MSQPAQIIKEAKGRHHELKEGLKTCEPWAREVEVQRKEIRRLYLRLLLEHPYSHESKDAETHLWMQTSYTFIALYKQHIADLDRKLHPNDPDARAEVGQNHGPVEYRKLLQRFRQFLAEEEKFWAQLVSRFRRTYALEEVQPILMALNLVPVEGDTLSEDDVPVFLSRSTEERLSRIFIVNKALICLGDIARYKEQYNESGGRPRAGREDGPPAVMPKRGGRNKRGGNVSANIPIVTRERNYERAQRCYEQARLLLPNEGNASNQLAILATYKRDDFSALVHYYRALCVSTPYEPATGNMVVLLRKALDEWRAKRKEKKKDGSAAPTPKARVDALKESVIILHSLWKIGDRKGSAIIDQGQRVNSAYRALVTERLLPMATISDVIILAHSALWRQRSSRDSALRRGEKSTGSSFDRESLILTHLLSLHRVLWEVGRSQVDEGSRDWIEGQDLAQKITAVLRRTLPSLRIVLKWTRANMSYLLQIARQSAPRNAENTNETQQASLYHHLCESWRALAEFSQALYASFPTDNLPLMEMPLDEDIDMRGFLPLRNMMRNEEASRETANGDWAGKPVTDGAALAAGVHPNVEQLMRISDILGEATVISEFEGSPVFKTKSGFFYSDADEESTQDTAQPPTDSDYRSSIGTSEAADEAPRDLPEDDPVNDAIRTVLEAREGTVDDDDDRIVWDLSASEPNASSSLTSPYSHSSPSSRTLSTLATVPLQQLSISPESGNQVPLSPSTQTGTTAQDLLNRFMGARSHARRPSASVAAPQLLFGSTVIDNNQSIWATSRDEALHFSNVGSGTSISMSPLCHHLPQSPWMAGQRHGQELVPSSPTATTMITTNFPPPPISTTFSNTLGLQTPIELSPRYEGGPVSPQYGAHAFSHHDGYSRNQKSFESVTQQGRRSFVTSSLSPSSPHGPVNIPTTAATYNTTQFTDPAVVGANTASPFTPVHQHWTSAR